ncbi:uncharacterized protein LOC117105857 [Anneissia japonica]|uniref:uncharacterized protein LOC117105857 n=1 Tax=Anneissia japonica TaxID=1529436 RepID=UPI00142573F8|nr:uncharacterized protein LOC117105857 [Anneissia japonica]
MTRTMLSIIVVPLLVVVSDVKVAAATLMTQAYYNDVVTSTRTLSHSTIGVKSRFKAQRIPQIVDTSVTLSGLPDVSALTYRRRQNMTEGDLLQTHWVNMLLYQNAMQLVVTDEQNYLGSQSFLSDFQNIGGTLSSTASKISTIIYLRNTTGTCITSSNGTLVFASDANEVERNERDYLVLYAIASYLPDTLADFTRLKNSL